MYISVCVCKSDIKWSSVYIWSCEVMCDTGNCRLWWDIFLVSDRTNTPISLSVFFLFFALQVDACLCVCVCDMHHVFVSLHLCRCLFACVGGGVKKWACQKWMIRLIRWNIPDSKIKHSRERKSSNKVRIKVHLECVCASSAMFSHKIFFNVFLHYHAMGVWKKNPFPTSLCAKPSQVSI